jgi:hypothetical protein
MIPNCSINDTMPPLVAAEPGHLDASADCLAGPTVLQLGRQKRLCQAAAARMSGIMLLGCELYCNTIILLLQAATLRSR